MRITNRILAHEAIASFQAQTRSLNEARRRAATGILVNRPSDDPIAAAGIMQSSSGLRALDQYRRNLQAGQSRLAVEDSVLDQITSSLIRAKELGIAQAGDPATAATRQATKAEIDVIIDFVTDLGNSRMAGSYVFGGQYSDTAPFQATLPDPLKPPSGSLKMEVGAGTFVETNHSAQDIFLDSDVVDALKALSAALGADDPAAVQTVLSRMDTAFSNIQELIGEVGARMNYLDTAVLNMDSLEVTIQTFRSSLADADLAEAVTELVARQGALEAAMLANSRILNLTLADYLR